MHRITFVFMLERGGWKMIQHHISKPDSNMDKMGIDHSAFQNLMDAARAQQHAFGVEGLATIMFTDIAGLPEINAALGDWL